MNPQPDTRPTRLWYLAPLVIMAAAVAVFVWSVGEARQDVEAAIAAMPRVVFPPGGEVEIAEPGRVVFYYETRSVVDGTRIESQRPQRRITLQVTPPPDAASAENAASNSEPNVEPTEARNIHWRDEGRADAKAVYDQPNHAGFAAWVYDAPVAGTYTLSASYSDPPSSEDDGDDADDTDAASDPAAETPTMVVAAGDLRIESYFNAWTGLFGAAAAVAIAMVVAVVIAVVIYIKRNRQRWQRPEA